MLLSIHTSSCVQRYFINKHTYISICPLRQPVIIITPPSSRARCFDWYPLLSFPTTFPTLLPPPSPQLLSRSLSKYYFSIWLDICEWKWMLSRPPHIPFAQRDTGCQEHLFLRLILLTYNLRHTCSMMPSPLLLDLFINIFFTFFRSCLSFYFLATAKHCAPNIDRLFPPSLTTHTSS